MTTSLPQPYAIDVTFRQTASERCAETLRHAARVTLLDENIRAAEISLVLTDDTEIHRINREFLGHDYPTDVISFRLDDGEPILPGVTVLQNCLEGELIISLDTAQRAAAEHGCSLEAEVILYVVHGLLHLCGYDDLTDQARPIMRRREREILSQLNRSESGESVSADGNDVLA